MNVSDSVASRPPDIDHVWPRNARPSDELLLQGPPTISPRVIRVTSVVCFLAWVFSVYDFVLFGTLLPKIADEFGWSASYATAIATWVTAGTFIVSLAVGPLLDRYGRKPALIITTAGAALASGLTAGVVGALSLIGVRSLSGLGYSEEVVNGVYLNEMYGKEAKRGFRYSLVQSGWPVGALLASAFAAVLLPLVSWRWVFLIATFPAIAIVILGRRLFESPSFVALRRSRELRAEGREAEAATLAELYDLDVSRDDESGLRQLFEPDLRRHTVCLSGAWLLNWMGIQVFSVLGTTILTDGKGVSFSNALVILILANGAGFLGYLFHGWLGDRIGRRTTIMIGWTVGGLAMSAMLFGPDSAGFVITMYAIGLFFLLGPYAAMVFYMGESFPARVRGIGSNTAHVMGPLGAIAGSGVLTAVMAAGLPVTTAAFVAGALGIFISGVLMLGARNPEQ
ncbi:MFS transporter [Gordonia hydrophobica]|uniref:MFS transporter n=1 Tax=Gordonia hydrophobica TaxID=40516 RepID=A0ABZ2U6W9_9ACTN|nr:MFS transporter [Gordonia hydrophobica]MBM7368260.1 MFS family permease [Gordonia hydrophobica]